MKEAANSVQPAPTPGWWVQVRGQAYGPYTRDQLTHFIVEGRVRPTTPVSENPERGWTEARLAPGLFDAPRVFGRSGDNENVAQVANIYVSAEIFSGASPRFMAALEAAGPMCEISPGLWALRTHLTVSAIRNALSQTLERGDRFVVIDATRDRLAWFNLGPEVDVKINHLRNARLPARV